MCYATGGDVHKSVRNDKNNLVKGAVSGAFYCWAIRRGAMLAH